MRRVCVLSRRKRVCRAWPSMPAYVANRSGQLESLHPRGLVSALHGSKGTSPKRRGAPGSERAGVETQFGANPEIVGTVLLSERGRAESSELRQATPGGCQETRRMVTGIRIRDQPDGRGLCGCPPDAEGAGRKCGTGMSISLRMTRDTEHGFLGRSLEEQMPGPGSIFRFAVFLALLALPAVAPVSFAEYVFELAKAFLDAKGSSDWISWREDCFDHADCLLCVSRFGLLAFSGVLSCRSVHSGGYFLFDLPVWGAMGARRSRPALSCLPQAGDASRTSRIGFENFLAWSGTELICAGGHTLLHVPGLPTSWFSTQRWMFLDSSWDSLFGLESGSSEGSAVCAPDGLRAASETALKWLRLPESCAR